MSVRRTSLRTSLVLAGGTLGLFGLLATPASACLPDGGDGNRATLADVVPLTGGDLEAADLRALRASWWSMKSAPATADLVALMQAKLDRIGARIAGDTAQWDGVTDLSAGQYRPAKRDLRTARHAAAWLAAVDASDRGTTAQQSQVDALRTSVRALKTHLRALLAESGERSFRSGSFDGDRDGWRDRDGDRDGWGDRDGSRDGDGWGDRDGRRHG